MNRLLGGSLKEGEWDDLVSEGYLDEIRRNPDPLDRVVAEAVEKGRHRRSIYGSTHGSMDHKAHLLSEQEARHSLQRSAIISSLAAQEAGVRSFRTEVPGDRYLSLEEIEEWFQQQAQKDGPPTNWLSDIPVARTKAEELMKHMFRIHPDTEGLSLEVPIRQVRCLSLQTRLLQDPGLDGWERSMPTARGGALERLRELSNELAKKYKWAKQNSEWKYTFVSNFAHDRIQARNRLFRIYTIDLTD
jgi:hypothetical protein